MLLDYDRIAKAIKSKGFNFVKVELESNINYRGIDRVGVCDKCKGKGKVKDWRDGRRKVRCDFCCGDGEYVIYIEDHDGFGRVLMSEIPKEIREGNTFWYAYNDGSVNTEVTFTIPVELIKYLPDTLSAFAVLAEESGGMDNSNAGMHLTVMEVSNYNDLKYLNVTKIRNFRRSMEKIISSLYPLASEDNEHTRNLHFRQAQIGINHNDKYSAIYTHDDTCIEYRIFDTCYKNTKRLSLYFNTIVKSLRYYDLTLNLNTLEYTGLYLPSFNRSTHMNDLYPSDTDVRRLLKDLIHIHPEPKLIQHLSKRFELGLVSRGFVLKNLTRK